LSYDASWHGSLRAAEEGGHPWFRARAALVADLLMKHGPSTSTVLDLGCGTGYAAALASSRFQGTFVAACDLSVEQSSGSAGRGVSLVRADLARLPFRNGFDAVLLLDVLEHFEDEAAVLASARSALREAGLLVVTVPAMPGLWSSYDERCGHLRRYRPGELARTLEDGGLEIVMMSPFMGFLAPWLFLSRRVFAGRRGSVGEAGGIREFRPGRLTATMASSAASVEKAMILRGVRFPFGSSIVAVARPVST